MNSRVSKKLIAKSSMQTVSSRKSASLTTPIPPVSQQVLEQLIDAVDDVRDKAIILCLADSGLRVSELVRLDRDMVTFATCEIPGGAVETTATGLLPIAKSGKCREFYLSPRAAEALKVYLDDERKGDMAQELFADRHGGRLRPRSISNIVHKWCDISGIKLFRLRDLRNRPTGRLYFNDCDMFATAKVSA